MGLLKAISGYLKELFKPARVVGLALYGAVVYVLWNAIGKAHGLIGMIITIVGAGLVSVSIKSVFKLGRK